MTENKWIRFGLISAIIVIFAAAICFSIHFYYNMEKYLPLHLVPSEHTKVDFDKPLKQQTRIIEIAGRTFEVPIMYIDGRPKPGKHQDSLLLEVIWPEMRSTLELKNRSEYDRIWHRERRGGWILLESESIRPPLGAQFGSRQHKYSRQEYIGKVGELEKYRYYLQRNGEWQLNAEFYLEKQADGQLKSFIECTRGPIAYFPICSHRFVHDGLLYQISYNEKGFLSGWRKQRQQAISFMTNMQVISDVTQLEDK